MASHRRSGPAKPAGKALEAEATKTDVKPGTVIGKCMRRHRAVDLRNFLDEVERNMPADLDVHVIMDNASSHKTKLIRRWFARRPDWHVHFTPTSASWINQVERFFALLSEKQIKRGAHRSVGELVASIQAFIDAAMPTRSHSAGSRPLTRSSRQLNASADAPSRF